VSYLPLPHARWVASPTWVLDRRPPFAPPPPLWRRRQPRRDACPGAVTTPACAAPLRATQAYAGPASAGRALRTRAAPQCNWAEREFGPLALKLIFSIF
jgi:hypothetical protein